MNKWLIAIVFLSALLRLPFLSSHISALYGDEISIGYNAWSILHTGKDEFGRFMPIQFESWGDQKNPVYIYVVSLFEIFFGLSATAVRLPSAISGILAVWLTYSLFKQLSPSSEKPALISALLLAVSPWHVHISRGGYEANMALTLGLSGIYFLVKWLKTEQKKFLVISVLSVVVSMYTYYTTKLFIPLIVLATWGWSYFFIKKDLRKYLTNFGLYALLATILSIPIIYLALFANGQARFASINIFTNPTVTERVITSRNNVSLSGSIETFAYNKPYIWLRDFLDYYLDNLSGSFWYVNGDSSLRYSIGSHGMFYLIEAPFFLLGLLIIFQKNKKLFIFLFGWIIIAILPTALVGKSYGLRSLALLPIPMIFTAFGLHSSYEYLKRAINSQFIPKIYVSTVIIFFVLSVSNWLIRYSYVYPSYGYYWYDGMQQEAIMYPLLQSKLYDYTFITRYYGKTEMYYAFYTALDPSEYQKCSTQKVTIANSEMIQCGKFYFGDINTKDISFEDLNLPPNSLVIGAPDASYETNKIIAKDDKRTLFKVISK